MVYQCRKPKGRFGKYIAKRMNKSHSEMASWGINQISINSKDIDQVLTLASDDCTWENVPTKEVCKGKEELRKYFKDLFTAFPDMNVELKSWFASGNQVCFRGCSAWSVGHSPGDRPSARYKNKGKSGPAGRVPGVDGRRIQAPYVLASYSRTAYQVRRDHGARLFFLASRYYPGGKSASREKIFCGALVQD